MYSGLRKKTALCPHDISAFFRCSLIRQSFCRCQVTILVPTNEAMLEYRGNRGEELALNHLVNAVVLEVNF